VSLAAVGILVGCLSGLVPGPPATAEGQLTKSERLRERIVFLGPPTAASGLEAVVKVTYEDRDGKDWPYASVAVQQQGGDAPVYVSPRYAAWFEVRLCWDDQNRLWIDSTDTGMDVIANTADAWRRHRWMPDSDLKAIRDVETGESLPVVDWPPPAPLGAPRGP